MDRKKLPLIGLIGFVIGFLGFCFGMYFVFQANVWIGSIVTFFGLIIFGLFVFIPWGKNRKEKKN